MKIAFRQEVSGQQFWWLVWISVWAKSRMLTAGRRHGPAAARACAKGDLVLWFLRGAKPDTAG